MIFSRRERERERERETCKKHCQTLLIQRQEAHCKQFAESARYRCSDWVKHVEELGGANFVYYSLSEVLNSDPSDSVLLTKAPPYAKIRRYKN